MGSEMCIRDSLVITLVLTTAFAALAVGELNLVSVAFTVLLIGLGLDFAIHLLLHIQERRRNGEDAKDALKGAVHDVGPALALAAPTTALAFLAFVPTQFDGIAQLGVIAGAGVLIAFGVSMTFLPAGLALVPAARGANSQIITKLFNRLSTITGPVAIAAIVLGAAALFLLPQVRFDADQMSLRNPHAQSVQGFNLLFEDENTVPYRLVQLASDDTQVRDIENKASAIDSVASTRSLLSFIPEDQDAKLEIIDFAAGTLIFALNAQESADTGPTPHEGVATLHQRLSETYDSGPGARLRFTLEKAIAANNTAVLERIERNIFTHWGQLIEILNAQLAPDYVEIDAIPAAIKNRYLSDTGLWRVDILPKEDVRNFNALETFVDSVEAVFPELAGGAYHSKRAGDVIAGAMAQATLIAFVVVALLLFATLRRLHIVALVLFPLALAAILTAATGVLINAPFNYANVIVLPLLIGIGVDSGIHLVMRQDQVEAGDHIYSTSTPRAVLFSALTTVASFGSLMLSPHRGTASMGQLLSIAIFFTLICMLVVLPAAYKYGQSGSLAKKTQS